MANTQAPRPGSTQTASTDTDLRLRLLFDTGEALSRAPDLATSLRAVAARAVGTLGDVCFVDLLDEAGNIARVAWAHVRPEKQSEFDALWPNVRPTRYALHPGALAIAEGEPVFEPNVDDAWLQRMAMGDTHLAFMRAHHPHSAMIVPLRQGPTPFGAITFWFSENSAHRHSAGDLALAMEVGRRAAVAISHERQHQAIARLNARLEAEVAGRRRERDRIWLVSDDMMAIAGMDGYLKAINPAWLRVLGFDEATLLSTPLRELGDPLDQQRGDAALAQLARGEAVTRFEARMRRSDGSWRWISWTVVPEGERYYAIGRDITEQHAAADELAAANRRLLTEIEERERVEATLNQMQRLEAIGQITSGVAHDFNNILTVLLGNVAFLERQFSGTGDAKLAQRLSNMRIAAERGATLTSQLLAFSRRQHLEPKSLSLNEILGSMRDLLQTALGGGVRVETALAQSLWPAFADPTQIELVILNLAINARDAMKNSGTLTISTANATLGKSARPEEPSAGDYVEIAVSDTGEGMEPQVLSRAFEPFFTTKETGRGSGLGLSQVLGFAKQSGGGVSLSSAPGAGTNVRVYLPRAPQAIETRSDEGGPPLHAASGSYILLVDDEAAVREVIAQALRDLGHRVVEAGSGGAALEIIEREPTLDVALLDFAMPGMNGAELARQIRARYPKLCVLFVTGYAETEALAGVSEEHIIKKPLRHTDLRRKLHAALAAHAA